MLDEFSVILWDFDGVIIDSNEIRTKGFIDIFESFNEEDILKLVDFHKNNGGLSRYFKINFFFKNILGIDISEDEILIYANNYKKYVLSNLMDTNFLIADSLNYIQQNYKKKDMHIVSASDENELRELCDFYDISKYFISLKGSPVNKSDNISSLIINQGYSRNQITYIGDSINDFESAKLNQINFFGYNIKTISTSEYSIIKKFTEL